MNDKRRLLSLLVVLSTFLLCQASAQVRLSHYKFAINNVLTRCECERQTWSKLLFAHVVSNYQLQYLIAEAKLKNRAFNNYFNTCLLRKV